MRDPSVTQVLKSYVDWSNVPQDVLEQAAMRGNVVHHSCACYAQGIWAPVPPTQVGQLMVHSFVRWFERYVAVVHFVERRLYHPVWQYVGHPDLLCTLKGESLPIVVDLKTPRALNKVWAGQCAAYLEVVRSCTPYNPRTAHTLRLSPTGGMPTVDHYTRDAADLAAFLAALQAHRYFVA